MARIIDTSPTFDEFAKAAFLESPLTREQLWRERYEAVHPEVFEAFYAEQPAHEGRAALARELSLVRRRASEAAPVVRQVIEEVEPAVRDALGLDGVTEPVHVLMVGPYSANAVVGRLGDDVALFHCLEWFQSEEGARTLVAHEDAHAWHQTVLAERPSEDDPAWMTFYEGLAVQVSRRVVPDASEEDYFWFGHAGFEDWLPWCEEHRDPLLDRLRESLDDPATVGALYGAGLIEGRWRVGYYLADVVVGRLERPLSELVSMTPDEGRAAVRAALDA